MTSVTDVSQLVAFLRAINVGGHNVRMEHLRSLISGYGLSGVETFIASGNVIVDGGRRSPADVESLLEMRLAADLGYPVGTFVRTSAELAAVVAAQPFSAAPGRYYVTFLKDAPSADVAARLLMMRSAADDFAFVGRELHWLVREGFQTGITDAQMVRLAPSPCTSRNISTVRKLAAKYPA